MKRLFWIFIVFAILITLLFQFGIVWKSPPFFKTKHPVALNSPIMDMETYMDNLVGNHRRPYIYVIESKTKGKVIVLGLEHLNTPNHPQFDSIRHYWNLYKPTIALVEGRLGFLFKWMQNPIKHYGESGLTSELAKKDGVDLYTWEPSRDDEIELLIKKHPAKQLAMFYALRPFFGKSDAQRKESPEKQLQTLINERTDYKHLKHSINTWEEIDSTWKKDFPSLNWRTYNAGYGYPGYLNNIWNDSNLTRDEHMVRSIVELVEKGETVFVTMGVSHAPRVEEVLKSTLSNF